MSSGRNIIIALSMKNKGKWEDIYKDMIDKLEDDYIWNMNALAASQSGTLTVLDEEYPESLKHVKKPPFVLYTNGDASLLKSDAKKMYITGDRDIEAYIEKARHRIHVAVDALPEDGIVVCGGARGSETEILKYAMIKGHKCIVVLGCGINNMYPEKNTELVCDVLKSGGLVISEYPAFTGIEIVSSEMLVMRKRIMAGISNGIVVTNMKDKSSGTGVSVMTCLENGLDVYAVPDAGDKTNRGANELIEEGAFPVLGKKSYKWED